MLSKIIKSNLLIIMIVFANYASATHCVETQEIQPNIFLKMGHPGQIFTDSHLANTSFVIGEKSIAVIDTGGNQAEGEALLCAIRKRSNLPISHVINTHVHPDHMLGNIAFKDQQPHFVGHKHLSRAMALLGPTYIQRLRAIQGSVMTTQDLTPPDITVTKALTIDLGGRRLQIVAIDQAHTDNDLTVFDEHSNTLWLGDLLFVDHIPVLGGSGSVTGWLNFLDTLKQQPKLSSLQLIPGHGKPITADHPAITRQYNYLSTMRQQVREWLAEDKSLSQALKQIGKNLSNDWPMAATFHQRNISYMYSELEWE